MSMFMLYATADGWSGWGVIGYAPEECQLGVSETMVAVSITKLLFLQENVAIN